MDTSANGKSANKGFTLVEILVVITIIGMLMAMLLGAVQMARTRTRNAIIEADLKQFDMSLANYKAEFTELPPSFMNVNIVAERGGDAALQNAGRAAVVRHLAKAFPRYVPGGPRVGWASPNPDGRPDVEPYEKFANDVYYQYKSGGVATVDPLRFDAASALVFFLGGLPEVPTRVDPANPGDSSYDLDPYVPAGFHTDPENPFKPGLPRTEPLSRFKPERVIRAQLHHENPMDPASAAVPRYLRYYPDKAPAPYVYFRSHRIAGTWQYGDLDSAPAFVQYWYPHAIFGQPLDNHCVPYCVPNPNSNPRWRNYDSCQVISAGLDARFGTTLPRDSAGNNIWRATKTGLNFSRDDFDNLCNFSERRLQDEMEQ